jgi:hypothetical protein
VDSEPASPEKELVFFEISTIERTRDGEEDSLDWHHIGTGTDVTLMLDQKTHPIAACHYYIRQFELVEKIRNYNFRIVEDASSDTIDKIRRVLDPNWIIMQMDGEHLLWAFLPTEKETKVKKIEHVLRGQGIRVFRIRVEDLDNILTSFDFSGTAPTRAYISSEDDTVLPIWLDKRIFMLSRTIKGFLLLDRVLKKCYRVG